MTSQRETNPDPGERVVFRYRVARHSWLMLGILVTGVTLVVGSALLFGGGWRVFDEELMMSIGLVMIVLGVVLLPAPLLDILSVLRSYLIVSGEGLTWRGLGGSKSFRWEEIVGIGIPPDSPRRVDDQRFHVLLDDEYEFMHGYNLRDREDAADLMRRWGRFSEETTIERYCLLARRGKMEKVRARAGGHLLPLDTDPWDFWSGRFRR